MADETQNQEAVIAEQNFIAAGAVLFEPPPVKIAEPAKNDWHQKLIFALRGLIKAFEEEELDIVYEIEHLKTKV